mmetsp:Transcript_44785/g.140429  ORF Transcript_44785/g.140429 Transcript_44785/m.140429 type:complete len:232 (+) Transcript_44785:409-1104(+)
MGSKTLRFDGSSSGGDAKPSILEGDSESKMLGVLEGGVAMGAGAGSLAGVRVGTGPANGSAGASASFSSSSSVGGGTVLSPSAPSVLLMASSTIVTTSSVTTSSEDVSLPLPVCGVQREAVRVSRVQWSVGADRQCSLSITSVVVSEASCASRFSTRLKKLLTAPAPTSTCSSTCSRKVSMWPSAHSSAESWPWGTPQRSRKISAMSWTPGATRRSTGRLMTPSYPRLATS